MHSTNFGPHTSDVIERRNGYLVQGRNNFSDDGLSDGKKRLHDSRIQQNFQHALNGPTHSMPSNIQDIYQNNKQGNQGRLYGSLQGIVPSQKTKNMQENTSSHTISHTPIHTPSQITTQEIREPSQLSNPTSNTFASLNPISNASVLPNQNSNPNQSLNPKLNHFSMQTSMHLQNNVSNLSFSRENRQHSQNEMKPPQSGMRLKWKPAKITTDVPTSPLAMASQPFKFESISNSQNASDITQGDAPPTPSKALRTVWHLNASKYQPQPDPSNIYISKLLYGIGFLLLSFSFYIILMFSLVSKVINYILLNLQKSETITKLYLSSVPPAWQEYLSSYDNFLWLEWHYSLLFLLFVPVVVFFTYLNWLSMKYFRHN